MAGLHMTEIKHFIGQKYKHYKTQKMQKIYIKNTEGKHNLFKKNAKLKVRKYKIKIKTQT